MKIDINKIIGESDFKHDFEGTLKRLEVEEELIVFNDNKPACVIMSLEQYEKLNNREDTMSKENELKKEIDDKDVVVLLNKIGKKIFVEYFEEFRKDQNVEEKLPSEFTLNSKRSRASSARKIFNNDLEVTALKIIISSTRVEENIIELAKEILSRENKVTESNEVCDSSEEKIKIGKTARIIIKKFLVEKLIAIDEIKFMEKEGYSKEIFNMNIPILKEIDENISLDKQKRDSRGYNRYYNISISAYGKEYLLCSQWVENLHRALLDKWMKIKLKKALEERIKKLATSSEFIIPKILNDYWIYVSFDLRKSVGRDFILSVRNDEIKNVAEVKGKKKDGIQVYKTI